MKYIVFNDKEQLYNFSALLPPDIALEKVFLGIGVRDDKGYDAGILVGDITGCEMLVKWIYVTPKNRRKGIATQMLNRFLDFVKKSGNTMPVSATYKYSKDNESVHQFFYTFERMDIRFKSNAYAVGKNERKDSELYSKIAKMKAQGIRPISELWIEDSSKFLKHLKYLGYSFMDEYEKDKSQFVGDLCLCRYFGGEVKAAVFFKKIGEKKITLFFAYATKGGTNLAQVLIGASGIIESCYSDYVLEINPITGISDVLLKKMFPNAGVDSEVFTAEWNYR